MCKGKTTENGGVQILMDLAVLIKTEYFVRIEHEEPIKLFVFFQPSHILNSYATALPMFCNSW